MSSFTDIPSTDPSSTSAPSAEAPTNTAKKEESSPVLSAAEQLRRLKIQEKVALAQAAMARSQAGPGGEAGERQDDRHKFWSTQPVSQELMVGTKGDEPEGERKPGQPLR